MVNESKVGQKEISVKKNTTLPFLALNMAEGSHKPRDAGPLETNIDP